MNPHYVVSRTGDWGPGKLLAHKGRRVLVEHFVKPASPEQIKRVVKRAVDAVPWKPSVRTRMYFEDHDGRWHVGMFRWRDDYTGDYVLQMPGLEFIRVDPGRTHVRWRGAKARPLTNLGNHFSESPRYHNARQRVVRALSEQRVRACGMTGLLSASTWLYPHQVEVVRRVLQDPVLRYLLADEVGLGKTIEAGAIVRQYHLDRTRAADPSRSIVIAVPAALSYQWRRELATRFHLDPRTTPGLLLLDYDDVERGRMPETIGLLVVDEAHNVAQPHPPGGSVAALIAAAALKAPSLLLLSATPALHNEAAFLAMLHMLDPTMYDVADVDGFKQRLRARNDLAEAFFDFHVEADPDEIEEVSTLIRGMFPDDRRLAELLDRVDEAVEGAFELDEAAVSAVRDARLHIGETYRLHRRVLRNRRQGTDYPVRGRSGVTVVTYPSPAELELESILENWRLDALVRASEGDGSRYAQVHRTLIQAWLRGATALAKTARHAREAVPTWAPLLDELQTQALEVAGSRDQVGALLAWLDGREDGTCRVVLFADEAPGLADTLTQRTDFKVFELHSDLGRLACRDLLEAFESAERSILLCDAAGEEGVNLQFADHVVHWNLPFSPNRIEQRMGRIDRHDDAERPAVPITVFLAADAPLSVRGAWLAWLDQALKVFDESASSLQFFLDSLLVVVEGRFFTDGPDGILDHIQDYEASINDERRTIARHQNLDAIDASMSPSARILSEIQALEEDWPVLEAGVEGWVLDTLNATKEHDERRVGCPFRYCFSPHTSSIPRTDLKAHLSGCLSTDQAHFETVRKSAWMTYDRKVAVASGASVARPGSGFLESLKDYLDWDDRGTSYAMLRYRPELASVEYPPVVFRFDFQVVGNAKYAAERVKSKLAKKAVERRMDELFPPIVHTIWIDQGGRLVNDENLLGNLQEDFRPWRITHTKAWDFNLARLWRVDDREIRQDPPRRQRMLVDHKRRRKIQEMRATWSARGPVAEYFLSDDWGDLCLAVQNQARDALRVAIALEEHCAALAGRAQETARISRQQLEMRSHLDGVEAILAEIETHAALYDALVKGVSEPRIRVDAVGTYILTATPTP